MEKQKGQQDKDTKLHNVLIMFGACNRVSCNKELLEKTADIGHHMHHFNDENGVLHLP